MSKENNKPNKFHSSKKPDLRTELIFTKFPNVRRITITYIFTGSSPMTNRTEPMEIQFSGDDHAYFVLPCFGGSCDHDVNMELPVVKTIRRGLTEDSGKIECKGYEIDEKGIRKKCTRILEYNLTIEYYSKLKLI